jgi:hypothetical protein
MALTCRVEEPSTASRADTDAVKLRYSLPRKGTCLRVYEYAH